MLTNGAGAIFLKGPFQGIDLDVFFTENAALDGGGMFLLGAGQVVLQNVRYLRNRAARNGGALCLIASLPSGQTTLQSNFFRGNSARRGGGIFVDGVSNFQIFVVDGGINEFIKNKALAGGAIHVRPSSQVNNIVRISDAEFNGNEAVLTAKEAEINRLDLPDVEVETTALGRRLHFHRTLTQVSEKEIPQTVLLDTDSLDACHPGGGGAMCLLTAQVPERAPVEIMISDVNLRENSAYVGGAIFAATSTDDDWIAACDSDGSAVESLTSRPCRSFSIFKTEFRSNTAGAAGGGLFVSHPQTVYISTAGKRELVQLSSLPISAEIFRNNAVEKGGFGDNVASNAASMIVKNPKVPDGELLIVGHNSGDELPEIKLELLDVFNQTVTRGIRDAAMSVSVNSSVVSGQRVATAENGQVIFSKVTALGRPVEHPIVFVADSELTASVRHRFSIRQCIVGESRVDDKNICDVCDEEFFGFNYTFTCDGCPDNARCEGAAVLVPIFGYWHSTPYSPIMHECLLEDACKYRNRRARLTEFYSDPASLIPSNETVSDEIYPQCAEEYTGPLCGSCIKGYGHVSDGECVECRHVWLTAILIAIVCLWTLFLLVSTAKAAFDTIREMHDMRMVRVLTMNTGRGGAPVTELRNRTSQLNASGSTQSSSERQKR